MKQNCDVLSLSPRPHKDARLQQLRDIRAKAEDLLHATTKPSQITTYRYEREVMDKLKKIQEDI